MLQLKCIYTDILISFIYLKASLDPFLISCNLLPALKTFRELCAFVQPLVISLQAYCLQIFLPVCKILPNKVDKALSLIVIFQTKAMALLHGVLTNILFGSYMDYILLSRNIKTKTNKKSSFSSSFLLVVRPIAPHLSVVRPQKKITFL